MGVPGAYDCIAPLLKPERGGMFDDVPTRAWLLLLIAIVAWMPMQYIVRHLAATATQRDITQAPDDLSWRSTAMLIKSVAAVMALAAFALFIFTPSAEVFARSPSFYPLFLLAGAALAMWSVVQGFTTGRIEPWMRGLSREFTRADDPNRYWMSMGWNALLSGGVLVFGIQTLLDVPKQALRDHCYDRRDEWAPTEVAAACNTLLDGNAGEDRPTILAARGSAYYRMGDYRRAGTDYAAAIQLDPKADAFHYNLGLVHDQLGDRKRAIAAYSAAIAINAENTDAYRNRASDYLQTGGFDAVISDATIILASKPGDLQALVLRGIAHAWKRDATNAERDFAEIRKIDPANLGIIHGESILALQRGDLREGIRLLSLSIARNSRNLWPLSMRAEAYRRLGEWDKMNADLATIRRQQEASKHLGPSTT